MARYLKDRRSGELFGFNHEMAKLPYMAEVDSDDKDFNDGKPDPDYVEEDGGFPISNNPWPQADIQTNTDQAQQSGFTDFGAGTEVTGAATEGEAGLDGDGDGDDGVSINPAPVLVAGEPPWAVDMSGNRLYDEKDNPLVYVLDEVGVPSVDGNGELVLEVYQEPTTTGKKTSKK